MPKAQNLFLVFAIIFGLIFTVLIPPMGGGNERFNMHRATSIAYGGLIIKEVRVPAGIAEFIEKSSDYFPEGSKPPFGYSTDNYKKLAEIPLQADNLKTLEPNPIAVLNPLAYLPQSLTIRVAAMLGASPLVIFYLAKLAGLAVGIFLTYKAIKIIPSHKYALCALALLPTLCFNRSTLDADQITNPIAFLFIALVLRELTSEKTTLKNFLYMAATGFIIAQCKTAYMFLPLLALAIPARNISRLKSFLVIFLPGFLASIAWMAVLKLTYFSGIKYSTWAGSVNPDMQIAYILHDPINYLIILLRTVFLTPFIPEVINGLVGVFGPPVTLNPLLNGILFMMFLGVIVLDSNPKKYSSRLKIIAGAIFVVVVAAILTLLYIQWTGYQEPIIKGFQGRYLYPILPLLFLFTKPISAKIKPAYLVAAIAVIGLPAATWLTIATYF